MVTATVTDESGQPVEFYQTDRTNGESNTSAFLIPKKPLKPNTTYTINFIGRSESMGTFERTWSFTTNDKKVEPPSEPKPDREPNPGERRIKLEGSENSYIWINNVVAQEDMGDTMMLIAEAPVKISFEGERFLFKNVATIPEYNKVPLSNNSAVLRTPGVYGVYATPEEGVNSTAVHIRVIEKEEAVTPQPENNKTEIAKSTSSKVVVNGETISFDAYKIAGNNYFKLRDLAMVVTGSEKQFEVAWNASRNSISLQQGEAYTPVGGELAKAAQPSNKNANRTNSTLYIDGLTAQLTAYKIDGNNYFKLRDIAKAFNIGVIWDAKANTIKIDTSIDYVDE